MKLSYVGQNQYSGLHAKKSGVIFLKPKLLDKKHGDLSIEENSALDRNNSETGHEGCKWMNHISKKI